MDGERARGTGANELLHRDAIEAACADERQSYDFGFYQTEELKKFKSTFGAREVPVHAYYFETLPTAAAEAKCYHATKQAVAEPARPARRASAAGVPPAAGAVRRAGPRRPAPSAAAPPR